MTLSSSAVGMRIVGRLEIFDVILISRRLALRRLMMLRIRHGRQMPRSTGFWFWVRGRSCASRLLEPVINPHQRGFPVEFARNKQRSAARCLVGYTLG